MRKLHKPETSSDASRVRGVVRAHRERLSADPLMAALHRRIGHLGGYSWVLGGHIGFHLCDWWQGTLGVAMFFRRPGDHFGRWPREYLFRRMGVVTLTVKSAEGLDSALSLALSCGHLDDRRDVLRNVGYDDDARWLTFLSHRHSLHDWYLSHVLVDEDEAFEQWVDLASVDDNAFPMERQRDCV